MTLPSFTNTAPKHIIGNSLMRQAKRLDRALQNIEKGARIRLVRSLRKAERELEAELKGLYLKALEETANLEAIEWREARAKILLAQVRSNLNIAEHAANLKELNTLVHTAALAG